MTFKQLADKWLDAQVLADVSQQNYERVQRNYILPAFGSQACDRFDFGLIGPWLTGLCKADKHSVTRTAATIMLNLCDELVRKRYAASNPMKKQPLMQLLRNHGYTGPCPGSTSNSYIKPAFIVAEATTPFSTFAVEWAEGEHKNRVVREQRIRVMTDIWIPAFGTRPLPTIDRLDILRVTIPLQRAKRLDEALLALRVLWSCFTSAIHHGLMFCNPARSEIMCLNMPTLPAGLSMKEAKNPHRRLKFAVREEQRHRKHE